MKVLNRLCLRHIKDIDEGDLIYIKIHFRLLMIDYFQFC